MGLFLFSQGQVAGSDIQQSICFPGPAANFAIHLRCPQGEIQRFLGLHRIQMECSQVEQVHALEDIVFPLFGDLESPGVNP